MSKAWQRHLKRHGSSQEWQFLAMASPALQSTLQKELEQYGFTGIEICENGVRFTGRLAEVYRAHLVLRSCSRLFLLFPFRATSLEELHRKAQKLPWEFFLPLTNEVAPESVQIFCHTRRSRISLPVLASRSLYKAIQGRLEAQRIIFGQAAQAPSPPQRIHLFVEGYRAQLLVDASGHGLHAHGYRCHKGWAPLREDLAAGLFIRMLQLLGPVRPHTVVNGMCGSGTMLLEAILALQQVPCRPRKLWQGKWGDYAFEHWPLKLMNTWHYLCRQIATAKIQTHFIGLDSHLGQLTCARENYRILASHNGPNSPAGVFPEVQWLHQNFFTYPAPTLGPASLGFLLLNPPYGLRLGDKKHSKQIYQKLARHLQQHYRQWAILILVPTALCPLWEHYYPYPACETIRIRHGGLWIRAYFFL